ncbi:hypothetical protein GE061_007547 [Apolygus lucorum]|uniref:Uncharacterized protein n=1 Tax=Apolygus lucorum TaxID=248454 RepID=A0A8S9WTR7_APOLU|nr:hypothetical protein GE061_007547 [Apolygus lucorum]
MEDVPVGLRTNYKNCELEIRSRLRREWSVDYESGTGAGEWTWSIFMTPANTPWYKGNRSITNRQITEWIPAHVDVPKNVVCDKLARFCAERGTRTILPSASAEEAGSIINETSETEHTQEHHTRLRTVGGWTEEIFGLTDLKEPWYRGVKGNKLITSINRLLTGHGNTRYFKYLMGVEQSPVCDCREGVAVLDHTLNECSRHAEERMRLFNKYNITNFQELLRTAISPATNTEILQDIIQFIENNQIEIYLERQRQNNERQSQNLENCNIKTKHQVLHGINAGTVKTEIHHHHHPYGSDNVK